MGLKSFVIDAKGKIIDWRNNRTENEGELSAAPADKPKLEPTDDNQWRLVEDWPCKYNDLEIVVPKGFVTDGASIPRIIWTLCGHPMQLPRVYAAIVHDYLYTIGPRQDPNPRCEFRKKSDKLYRDYQIQLGICKFKARIEYSMLRLFGGSHWEVEEEE